MAYTAEQLDDLFRSGALERIGMGSRRSCYRLPGNAAFCLKCYKSDEEILEGKDPGKPNPRPLAPSAVKEIKSFRFDAHRNTCCQEYRYWQSLPESVKHHFPSSMEILNTSSRGWCLIEELIINDDGSPIAKFLPAWEAADEVARRQLADAFDSLEESFAQHAIRFFDPQTIMVQRTKEGLKLRIPDFEPATRTLIPVDVMFPALTRMKMRRRFARYRKIWGAT